MSLTADERSKLEKFTAGLTAVATAAGAVAVAMKALIDAMEAHRAAAHAARKRLEETDNGSD